MESLEGERGANAASLDAFAAAAEPVRPLANALWHAARGDWEAAHVIVAGLDTRDAAWLHAHLHRVEGDTWNAGYWYRRAGREAGNGDLRDELAEQIATLASRNN
jgi:hypothetical protein